VEAPFADGHAFEEDEAFSAGDFLSERLEEGGEFREGEVCLLDVSHCRGEFVHDIVWSPGGY
jgi:hypothetical protein